MNMHLSKREKILLCLAGLAMMLLVYWYWLYNPLLRSIDRTQFLIISAQQKLEHMKVVQTQPPKNDTVVIYPREKQLSRILGFIDKSFGKYRIDLISLRQVSENNKLTIDLKFRSTYYQFLGFINALGELDTVILIDTVNIALEKGPLVTEMRLLSGYR
jgi:hypothetical protein